MKRIYAILMLVMITFITSVASAQNNAVSAWVTTQEFERGMMLYRSDTGLIWVLGSNGSVKSFASATYGKLRDNRIKSSTVYTTQFGFGKVWGNYAAVRRMIGSPVGSEGGALMTITTQGGTSTLMQGDGTIYTISKTWKVAHNPNPHPNSRVTSLTTNLSRAQYGSPLDISWRISDADLAVVEVYDGATDQNIFYFDNLGLGGTLTITVPHTTTRALRVVVTAYVLMPQTYQREWRTSTELTIPVDGDSVNMTTVITYAAYQPFQNGFMVWRSDTDDVYVFINGAGMTTYTDPGTLPLPAAATPPSGLIMPINAFGRVWGGIDAYIGKTIGWATGAEQGFQTTVSTTENNYWPTIMTIPGGRTVTLDVMRGVWGIQ